MAVITIQRMAEEIKNMLDGGFSPVASTISFNEIKIAIGQVANSLLKTEYFNVNAQLGETIPNGTMIGLYENIPVTKWNNKAVATLPIKPIKLRRNMGIFSVFLTDNPDVQFIPLQMGEAYLMRGQRLLNDLSGQTGYENFGDQIVFQKDITDYPNEVTVSMRLAIMDINEYGDFEPLPILPEMEWEIKQQVFAFYMKQPTADRLVDSTTSEQKGVPIKGQSQN
jgi:hypothetical protein